jgi:hypothetical protein
MDEMIILDIKINDTIDILCYEGNYNEIYDDEDKLCHYFKIKPKNKNSIAKLNNKLIDYIMYINEKNKEIDIYNYSNGDSIIFKYIEVKELNYGHKEIINTKIKYLFSENNKLNKLLVNKNVKTNDIIAYLNKDLENINKKIQFFEQNNNEKNLFKNIGKKEIIEKILDKLNKKY